MGIVSQLRDAQGGDTDMATLVELLQNMSQGKWVDTTPFGLWGVRDMDPGKLGALMNTASGINQKRMESQEVADAMRRQSQDRLAGTLDTNDVAEMGQGSNERIALQRALTAAANQGNLMDIEKLRSATGLEREGVRGQWQKDVANINANPKSMSKIPDNLAVLIHQTLTKKDAKPEEFENIARTLDVLQRAEGAASMRAVAEKMRQEQASKPAGPTTASRISTFFNPYNYPSPAENPMPSNWYQTMPMP